MFLGAVTNFIFKYPSYMIKPKYINEGIIYDKDDDIDVNRQQKGKLGIGIVLISMIDCVHQNCLTVQYMKSYV